MLLKNNTLFGLPTEMVMDPVHGGIHYFSHEKTVIDHPLFQRSRFISQTDILNLVFPGSQHTRFQHSIGTMHLAGKFFQSLVKSYLIQFKRQEYLSSKLVESINYLHGCIRLAALLHDTGHAPFSHQFEHSKQVSSLLTKELFVNLWKNENHELYFQNIPSKVEHEHFSIRIAHEIFKTIPNIGISVNDVIFFMEKSDNSPSTSLISHISNLITSFVKNITQLTRVANEQFLLRLISSTNFPLKVLTALKTIISGEIDADKMDYILRDAYFSGSKYGNYNIDSILNSLRIGYKYNGFKIRNSTWIGIAIDPKGLSAIENFIYSRFQLHLELYNHKTVCGFKLLLAESIDETLTKSENLDFVKECLSDINKYPLLTDSFLWEDFKKTAFNDLACLIVFIISMVMLKVAWREKGSSHANAVEQLFSLKQECTEILELPDDENMVLIMKNFNAKYSQINSMLIKIPDRKFNALKLIHKRKVELSKLIDKYPGSRLWLLKFRLFFNSFKEKS